jgi:hypothetical protein
MVMVILLPSSLRQRSLAALRTVLPEVRIRVRIGVKVWAKVWAKVWVRVLPSPTLRSDPSACLRKSPVSPRVSGRVMVRVRVQVRVRAMVTYVEVVLHDIFSILFMDFPGAHENVVVPGRLGLECRMRERCSLSTAYTYIQVYMVPPTLARN